MDAVFALLRHARAHVPFYANIPVWGPSNNLSPAAVLSTLPLLTRQDVRASRHLLTATTGDIATWRSARTTGTTGEPVEVVLDAQSRMAEANLFTRCLDNWIDSPKWREGPLFHLTLHPQASSIAVPAPWNDRRDVVKWNLARAWAQSDEMFRTCLMALNGAVITMMPSVTLLLVERLSRLPATKRPQPSLIVLSGETIDPGLRTRVAEFFQCKIKSLYTMAEIGIIAVESEGEKYQPDTTTTLVEIIDGDGRPTPAGSAGEIVITSLCNFAMPLIRYCTGDRGRWVDGSFSQFELVSGRKSRQFRTSKGSTFGMVRFAKVLASLDVDWFEIEQPHDGAVHLYYKAERGPIAPQALAVLKVVLRGALGPSASIRIERVRHRPVLETRQSSIAAPTSYAQQSELQGPDTDELSEWLRDELQRYGDIEVAVLTGSVLDRTSVSRFSDIDLALFISGDPWAERWLHLAQELRAAVPTLSTHVDRLAGLPIRAPLFACRLQCEHLPIVGGLDESCLTWPSSHDIRRAGILWAQSTLASLWSRSLEAGIESVSPITESWTCYKLCLDALRYRYLARSERSTAPGAVYIRASADAEIDRELRQQLTKLRSITLELEPPPRATSIVVAKSRLLAINFIRATQDFLSLAEALHAV
jgi:phenylacetate-CoA ligase